jgi:hypothetical protein
MARSVAGRPRADSAGLPKWIKPQLTKLVDETYEGRQGTIYTDCSKGNGRAEPRNQYSRPPLVRAIDGLDGLRMAARGGKGLFPVAVAIGACLLQTASRRDRAGLDPGSKAFELSAGFLRISNGGDPLDSSGVHPEAYSVVRRILAANWRR